MPKYIYVYSGDLTSSYRYGRRGDAFGIPSRDEELTLLSLDAIWVGIRCIFVPYIIHHLNDSMQLHYYITAIGCEQDEYKPEQIAPLFKWCLQDEFKDCCRLPQKFLEVL